MEIREGSRIGIYEFVSRLGAGGMGEVWRAEDTRLGRPVAVKVLPPSLESDEESRGRLLREARTAAQLTHPNIATIHAIEHQDDAWFIVMEYVEGQPLSRRIRQGMTEQEACRIARDVAQALSAAHRKGIVHRDIKPDNILVSDTEVKVLDFGIAKRVSPEDSRGDTFVTQTGVILGTIHYMSPEQALGRTLDGRTDLYSLGVVLFEAVTGRLPFHGDTITDVLAKIIRDEPPDPEEVRPSISPAIADILRRCLNKDRDRRFDSAEALAQALEAAMLVMETEIHPTVPLAAHRELEAVEGNRAPQSPAPSGSPMRGPSPEGRLRRWPARWLAIILIVVAGAFWLVLSGERGRENGAVTENVPSEAVSSTESIARDEPPAEVFGIVESDKELDSESAEVLSPVDPTRRSDQSEAGPLVTREENSQEGSAAGRYAEGLERLKEREYLVAAARFEQAIRLDPAFGPAHLKLGEMLLVRRAFVPAARQLELALQHQATLTEREILLARLGLALIEHKPEMARALREEMRRSYPNDPELEWIEREFERNRRPRRRLP